MKKCTYYSAITPTTIKYQNITPISAVLTGYNGTLSFLDHHYVWRSLDPIFGLVSTFVKRSWLE